MGAIRAFAQCAEQNPGVPGYCRGSLQDAKMLANQDVCERPSGCDGRVNAWVDDDGCHTDTGAGTACTVSRIRFKSAQQLA